LRVRASPALLGAHPQYREADDVDALVAELRGKGVTILREPFDSPAGNRVAHIADPDGTWILVQTRRAG